MQQSRLICLILFLISLPVLGAIEEYDFDNAQQEQRFKKLTYEMRCPKCLNSSLAGSDAPIAADLRKEIYEQIREGRSNEEIVEFMTSRYGQFILYRPRLTKGTFLLWFGPPLLLVAGFFIVRRMMRGSQLAAQGETSLTAEEQERLHRLLDTDQG